jgi:hypothetical protein
VILFALGLAPMGVSRAESRPNLYVFLLSNAKSSALEKALQSKLPGLSVTLFRRYGDLHEALARKPPEALLTLQPVLDAHKLTASLRGLGLGEDSEKYVLLSAGPPLEGSLAGRTIGAVDILGHAETQTFVAALLKTPDVKTKLVTKLEDLLPMLQFSASDAVLVPARAVGSFTQRSRMSLQVREIADARVGRAAVAILAPEAGAIVVEQLQKLDAPTKDMIGVDSWRAR